MAGSSEKSGNEEHDVFGQFLRLYDHLLGVGYGQDLGEAASTRSINLLLRRSSICTMKTRSSMPSDRQNFTFPSLTLALRKTFPKSAASFTTS